MADKKQYFREVKPGEVSIEGRQSNGVTADNEGNVFIYSGLKDSELDNLAQQNNEKNIPIYYGNSYVAITKSHLHKTLVLGNNNYETLNEKVTDPNKITAAKVNDSNINCDQNSPYTLNKTTINTSYEFIEASKELLTWENDNTSKGNYSANNGISVYNGPWEAYGANGQSIKNGELDKAQLYMFNDYFSSKKFYNIPPSDFPPGLRTMMLQLFYNTGGYNAYNRLLATLYELNIKGTFNGNEIRLGVIYKKLLNVPAFQDYAYVRDKDTGLQTFERIFDSEAYSYPINVRLSNANDDNTALTERARYKIFYEQYDSLISYYKANKKLFLYTLHEEILRWYRAFTVGRLNDNVTDINQEPLYKFYKEYATKAYNLALKYVDCYDDNTPQVPWTPSAPVQVKIPLQQPEQSTEQSLSPVQVVQPTTQPTTPISTPKEDIKTIKPAPQPISTDDKELIFLEDQVYELSPVKLTEVEPIVDNGLAPRKTETDNKLLEADDQQLKKLAEESNKKLIESRKLYQTLAEESARQRVIEAVAKIKKK
jgi:hypothetical protein